MDRLSEKFDANVKQHNIGAVENDGDWKVMVGAPFQNIYRQSNTVAIICVFLYLIYMYR